MSDSDSERRLVTGASSGIGQAIALELARGTRRLFLTGRNADRLSEVARECGRISGLGGSVPHLSLDLTDPAAAETLLVETRKTVGTPTQLIHAAGLGYFGSPEAHDDPVMERLYQTNVLAAIRLTRNLLSLWGNAARGHLVYILSVASKRPFPHACGYVSTKFALRGYAEALRQDLRDTEIAITCAHPVATRTAFWNRAGYENWEETHARTAVHEAVDVATRLVPALEGRPREWFPNGRSRVLDFAHRIAPRLLEWVTARGAPPATPRFAQDQPDPS